MPRAIVALVLMSLIWGYNWDLVKEAMRHASPFDFSAIRTMGGGMILLGVLAWQGRPLRPRNVPMTLLVGILCTTLSVGSTWALVEGGAGTMAILVYAMPFWLILMAWPFLGERPQGMQWLAVALALAGLLLLLEPWSYRGDLFLSVLAVLSGLAWAASAVVTKRMDRSGEVDVVSLSAWQILLVGVGTSTAAAEGPVTVAQADRAAWGQRPLNLALAAFRRFEPRPGELLAGREARVVLVGDADFANDANIVREANRELVINMIRWLTGEELLIRRAGEIRTAKTAMALEPQHHTIVRPLVIIVPVITFLAGWIVWALRRVK